MLLGLVLWVLVLKSGIHATIAGVVALSLLLVPFAATGAIIGRWEGAVLIVSYAVFIVVVIVHSVG